MKFSAEDSDSPTTDWSVSDDLAEEKLKGLKKSSKVLVGFWRRFFADFLDAIILGIPGYGVGYLFRYRISAMGIHAIWIGLTCSFLYYGLQHTRLCGGQTPGKRLLGIQVLRRDGEYLGFGKSFLRYLVVSFIFYNGMYGSLLRYIPDSTMMAVGTVYILVVIWAFFACFLMIPLHPLKRGLHDMAADSIVVYKDCFDTETLNRLEDSAKTKRALVILTAVSCLFAGAFVWGVQKITSGHPGDMAEMGEIQEYLATQYDGVQVRANTFNGKAQSLAVIVYVPLATFDQKPERERIRQEILNKVSTKFKDLDRFGKLRVAISSGFCLGIANYNVAD
ncbi:RDD family protein [Geomonas sp. Red32]|uniref:RDD family protein n=1 Tax=Geomonas sp. Red32 TaxID=2912856 RepID=UPI00202CA7A7|nr:RDD family protein [Geomonas sp. Red32]MCM0081333.1 RDD family protein [Geomonas sp. Red32]